MKRCHELKAGKLSGGFEADRPSPLTPAGGEKASAPSSDGTGRRRSPERAALQGPLTLPLARLLFSEPSAAHPSTNPRIRSNPRVATINGS